MCHRKWTSCSSKIKKELNGNSKKVTKNNLDYSRHETIQTKIQVTKFAEQQNQTTEK